MRRLRSNADGPFRYELRNEVLREMPATGAASKEADEKAMTGEDRAIRVSKVAADLARAIADAMPPGSVRMRALDKVRDVEMLVFIDSPVPNRFPLREAHRAFLDAWVDCVGPGDKEPW